MARAVVNEVSNVDRNLIMSCMSCQKESENSLLFFSSIDKATKSWLDTLHFVWARWKKSDGVTKILTDYFNTAPNPYLSTLRILVNTSDFNHIKTKTSLAFTVIEEFSQWLSMWKDAYSNCLVPDLKIATFNLVSEQKNMQFVKLVSDVYEFIEHKELFLPMIQKMVEKKKFKEAAQYAAMLRLQSHFANPETILLALILQSKVTVVEDFLYDCPDVQKTLITYLDTLVDPGKNMQNTLDKYIIDNGITDVKMSTIQVRPMTKLIGRLAKMYNFSPDVCPNLNRRRGEGALQFLMYKRYMEYSLSGESWREMVREAVGTDPQLQLELIRVVAQADAKEALYWARAYDIPKQKWPWSVAHIEEENLRHPQSGTCSNGGENWDGEEDSMLYHIWRLPRECIKLIDSPKLFEEFLDEGLKGVTIVGIDSEWKPSFGIRRVELALIQIATETNVYILDVTTLGSELTDLWTELGLVLFENKSIVKLGFGLAHDMTMIRDSLPALSNIKACNQGYMDMLHLWRKLVQEYQFLFPYEGDENFTNENLSKLVELCLGQRLNKVDQFSNWERRPLRESQIIYAALDAYCLLEVYEALSMQCQALDIPFQEICAEIQHIPHKSPKKQSKKSSPKATTACLPSVENGLEYFYESESVGRQETRTAAIPAHEWRVVCDSMLGGLARQLRMCGCDCIHVEYDRGGDQSANLAMHEGRVLLTRGGAFYKFAQYVPPGNCYRVISDKPEDQLKEVLSHFDISVTQKDIFSRCQICNYDEFVQVSRNIMTKLSKRFAKVRSSNGYHLSASTSTEINFDNVIDDDADPDYDTTASKDFRFANRTDSARNKQDRMWNLSIETLDVVNCTTKYGTHVQIDRVPTNVLKNVQQFYICEKCGKVYWDGSHMERALNGVLRDIIVWK